MKKFFNEWNYKKHAKFVSAIYLTLYVIDMTLSYFVIKKCIKKKEDKKIG